MKVTGTTDPMNDTETQTQLGVRMSTQMRARIEKLAEKKGISASDVARMAILDALDKEGC